MKKINLFLILACVFMIFSCSDVDDNNFYSSKSKKTEVSTERIRLGIKYDDQQIELQYSQNDLIDLFNEENDDYSLIVSDITDDSIVSPRITFYAFDKIHDQNITFVCDLVKEEVSSGVFEYYLDPNNLGDPNYAYIARDNEHLEFLYFCVKTGGCLSCGGPIKVGNGYECYSTNCGQNGSCRLESFTVFVSVPHVFFHFFHLI